MEEVARAWFNKGFRLGMLGNSDAEMATYAEMLSRFGRNKIPEIRETVELARKNRALSVYNFDLDTKIG